MEASKLWKRDLLKIYSKHLLYIAMTGFRKDRAPTIVPTINKLDNEKSSGRIGYPVLI